jgi:hypothetical protein
VPGDKGREFVIVQMPQAETKLEIITHAQGEQNSSNTKQTKRQHAKYQLSTLSAHTKMQLEITISESCIQQVSTNI